MLCQRHYDLLQRAVRRVFEDWFGEGMVRGMTPVNEEVWGAFYEGRQMREKEEGAVGVLVSVSIPIPRPPGRVGLRL